MSDTLTADGLLALVRSIPRNPPELRFSPVPTWVHEERWVKVGLRKVPPRARRWGTRKMWKRRFNHKTGWQRRVVPVEPDHVMQTADGTVYCTHAQYAAIKARAGGGTASPAERHGRPVPPHGSGP